MTEVHQIGHRCGCGEQAAALPELDARQIPHAVRHGAILGALSQVQPGFGMVLVAPHDPLPLLKQIDDTFGDSFERSYLQQGPDAWKLEFQRRA
ncbi:DUF2249 domain-containing protein [Mariniluteicoccus flavus]